MSSKSGEHYYLAAAVRELDRLAIEDHRIPGFTLMQRAGQAAFSALLLKWPDTTHVICFCGSGNNGGDGYLIAALAKKAGLDTIAIALGKDENLSADARCALEMAIEQGVKISPFSSFNTEQLQNDTQQHCVLVDAMLGTGLKGDVRGNYKTAINIINTSSYPVLAVDIPSGLCSDKGVVLGDAVEADITVTFIGRKLGQAIAEGPQRCNEIIFDDLGVPEEIYQHASPVTL